MRVRACVRAQARCLVATDADLAEAQARLAGGARETRDGGAWPSYDAGVLVALSAAVSLNSPSLGLARLLRRLLSAPGAHALLSDTRHAEPVRVAGALLRSLAPNEGSGGGFRLELPRGARGGAGAARASALVDAVHALVGAEAQLLSGSVRCQQQQQHGSAPCSAAQLAGACALLRYLEPLLRGEPPPPLEDGVEPARPSSAALLRDALSEVCNAEPLRRVAR